MNILVTGANGQLGNEMRIVAAHGVVESRNVNGEPQSANNYIFTDIAENETTVKLDITDKEAVHALVKEKKIECIVNCAAYTNVDAAETNEPQAVLLNAVAPQNLAEAMKEVGGLLIHISTDYVFGDGGDGIKRSLCLREHRSAFRAPHQNDGKRPYKETDAPAPTSVYGRTKLQGEENIVATGCRHVIIRTAWLYSEFGKNFVKTILNLTAAKPQIKVVDDQRGTPTYAYDLAKSVAEIIHSYQMDLSAGRIPQTPQCHWSKEGIYHYTNEGECTWYGFAKEIANLSKGSNQACEILPCTSDEFPSPVKRPSYSVLDKSKIRSAFNLRIPQWPVSLENCLHNLHKGF